MQHVKRIYFAPRHRHGAGRQPQPSGRTFDLELGHFGSPRSLGLSLGVLRRFWLRSRLERWRSFGLACSTAARREAGWLDRRGCWRCRPFPTRKGPFQALYLLQPSAPKPLSPGLHRLLVRTLANFGLWLLCARLGLVGQGQGLWRLLEGTGWDFSLLLRVTDITLTLAVPAPDQSKTPLTVREYPALPFTPAVRGGKERGGEWGTGKGRSHGRKAARETPGFVKQLRVTQRRESRREASWAQTGAGGE